MDAIATSTWTDALEQEVIRRWLAKETATQISEAFLSRGLCISRNAILGKIHRLGLHRAKVTICQPVPRSPTLYRPVAPRKPKPPRPQPESKPFVPSILEISPRMVSLIELEHGQCRFECSGMDSPADYLFCGLPTKADNSSSYCGVHHPMVWVKPQARAGGRPFPRASA